MTAKAILSNGYLAFGFLLSSLLLARAQPVITNQPISQNAAVGTAASFSIGAAGSGPLTYTWQLNGTNLPGEIITVAGGGTGALGDNGRATNAFITNAVAIAVGSTGNLYIADAGNHRVRMVANGIIKTIAGTGAPQFSGDKGFATNASLNNPSGVAVDGAGQVYISDTGNNRIRKVDTNGIITTIIGNGTASFNGDGLNPTNTEISAPLGISLDSATNIYFADSVNNRVRRVFAGAVYTLEGSGAIGKTDTGSSPVTLHYPGAVAVDFMGDILIGDWINDRVIATSNSTVIVVAGTENGGFSGDGGPGPLATLTGVHGIAVDSQLNIYIADSGNNRIRKIGPNAIITNTSPIAPTTYSTFLSGTISTFAGNGSAGFAGDGNIATSASLNDPYALAVDSSGDVFISDLHNNRIREVLPYHLSPTLTLNNITVTNAGNYTVVVSDSTGCVTSSVATLAVGLAPSLTAPPTNQYVTVGGNITLSAQAIGAEPLYYEWFQNGSNLVQEGLSSTLTLTNATLDESGSYSVHVTNSFASTTGLVSLLTVGVPPTIESQTTGGIVPQGSNVTLSVTLGGTGPFTYTWQLNGITFSNNIILTIAGNGNNFHPNGIPATNAALSPYGICSDFKGNIFVANQGTRNVQKIDANGFIWNFAGNGLNNNAGDGLQATNTSFPYVLSVGSDLLGDIYIGGVGKIWKVDPDGISTTIAGTNKAGFSGDGGPALAAQIGVVNAISCGANGNVYFSDTTNNRIRMISPLGIITTVLGDGGSAGPFGTNSYGTNFGIYSPSGLALDGGGNVYVANYSSVVKVATNALASYVAGTGNSTADGVQATTSYLDNAFGLTFDHSGNLYLGEIGGCRIRVIATNGIIETVAGIFGHQGFSGDGGPAPAATFSSPTSLCFDPSGNLYIVDQSYRYIREVFYTGLPTLSITNASASNSGNYTLVISSPFGSVTSSVVSLELAVEPTISQIAVLSNGWRTVTFTGTPTASHQLLFTTNLTPPVSWMPVATNSAGFDGNGTLTDTNAPGEDGFYQVILPVPQ